MMGRTKLRVVRIPSGDCIPGYMRWVGDEYGHPEFNGSLHEERGWVALQPPMWQYSPEWIRAVADVKANPTVTMVTRTRVVRDEFGTEWGVQDGNLSYRTATGLTGSFKDSTWTITPARAALWADLLANPTEEAEATDDG